MDDIEQQIQAKGLTAPRLTPKLIEDAIVGTYYHVVPNTTMTLCVLTLKNGFLVTGESAAVSLENFDKDIGEQVAYKGAFEKIWALEGYLLKQNLFEMDPTND